MRHEIRFQRICSELSELKTRKKPEKIKDQPRRRHPNKGAECRICCYLVENDYSYKQDRAFKRSIYDFVASLNLTVFGCGVIPGGQTSTRTFTASGPSNLPIIAVYTENKAISAVVPGIATSKDAVQALAQRFAMQTVVDVLEIEGRRALLPDFVISNILGQLQVNTTYEPLECQDLKPPDKPPLLTEACIFVGSTVTGMCPMQS
ncbi:hypothetical protein KIN20_019245 [Parelaphostrongylus tenuis]|uniref:Uncharacterized protein n=1 Tax=Parelaphostrongylus tenuis TaxID=148309 RepID=A0AAD5QUY2_PARTN|nr:hypothetical protein KIN20_019245 [Parelaphostrongylus tenuis]